MMKNYKSFFGGLLLLAGLLSCQPKETAYEFIVKNNLNFDREAETIEIKKEELAVVSDSVFELLSVVDKQTDSVLIFQRVDVDLDGKSDVILVQPKVAANSQKTLVLKVVPQHPKFEDKTFSRFVPERTDDYAWENDRVAFRTYGPTAQKMVENDIEGGTLSSGIDCWLKRVDYLIIDKWYKKHSDKTGTYHEDTGEGLDDFHVGTSRGCGGIGVFLNDSIYTSKNFVAYRTIANGPIRTMFVLDYAPWTAADKTISESKTFILDKGSNFTKVIARVEGTSEISVGQTMHEKDGACFVDSINGWFSYIQPHLGQTELATAVVALPKYYKAHKEFVVDTKDQSHLLVHLNVVDNSVEYYTGFEWSKSNQFSNSDDWKAYLTQFAKTLNNPLTVEWVSAK